MLDTATIEWLESRCLDPEVAARYGWEGCNLPGGGGKGLKIPYFVGTDAVNHKYRGLEDKRFIQDKDATKCFWNFNAICDASLADQPLVITEGEMDALAAIQCGYVRTVSVPDGAPANEIGDADTAKYTYLEHARGALKEVREVILATDADGPGAALLNDLARRIGPAKCKVLRYPKGCKDLNETLAKYGEKGVHECFRRAQWFQVDGVYRMSELPPYHSRQAYSTGMRFLDPHYRVRMGDFCVVTGIPGHGKTTWVNDLTCNLAERYDWTIAIASFEQHPQADHRRALREWYCRKPVRECTPQEVGIADAWIDRHFVFIVPGEDDLANLEWTLDKCATAALRHGARVIVIDPWNELDHDRPADMSLTEYTGKAIKEFKRLARSLDVHVIVVAHPTKLSGSDVPGLYHISDSAHWANKADIGIVIWKQEIGAPEALCKVAKSRYHDEIGVPGEVWMAYDRRTRRFAENDKPMMAA